MESEIHERPVFEKLLFAQSWEDPELDIEALQIAPSDRVVVVTSGGCNALSLLTTGPRELIAIDMNPVQSWIMELKLAGIRALSHQELLTLLGVKFIEEPSPNHVSATALYAKVRSLLSPEARSFWDRNQPMIHSGVLQAGRFELYLGMFRRLLKFVVGDRTLRDLMRQSLETQAEFYRSRWDGATWRLFIRIFFSRRVLGKRGLDPEFFKYANGVGSFGKHWLGVARHALTDLPVRDNYFLTQICFGRYLNHNAVPRYLHPHYFDLLKENAGRVRILTDELEKFLSRSEPHSFEKFALSNVFEWVDEQTYEQLLQQLWRVATPGARLCYRNLLVRRERPASFEAHLRSDRERARRLLWRDRSFLYSNFVIEEVIK
jgi:S-adenosylmethionine-diacylglycerol 3-amino-3-carboxypropyl transferase